MRRNAKCLCGGLRVRIEGDPVFVNVCHCLQCQQRTGSAFSYNAYFDQSQVQVDGASTLFTRIGDTERPIRHRFCPTCGTTVWWDLDLVPALFGIPLGLFEDCTFAPMPQVSAWERSRRLSPSLPDSVRHSDGPSITSKEEIGR